MCLCSMGRQGLIWLQGACIRGTQVGLIGNFDFPPYLFGWRHFIQGICVPLHAHLVEWRIHPPPAKLTRAELRKGLEVLCIVEGFGRQCQGPCPLLAPHS